MFLSDCFQNAYWTAENGGKMWKRKTMCTNVSAQTAYYGKYSVRIKKTSVFFHALVVNGNCALGMSKLHL